MFRKKRVLEKVVTDAYWDGFFQYLGNGLSGSLSFASDSGMTWANEARDIAYAAGWAYAEEVLRTREEKKGQRFGWFTVNRDVPGKVMAECYGAARITCTSSERSYP